MNYYAGYDELMKINKKTFNRPKSWIDRYKDEKHKKCHGRGYLGIDDKGLYVPCICAIKNFLLTVIVEGD